MKKINNILDELYENRSDIFEENYIQKEEVKEKRQKSQDIENILINKINELIPDKSNQKQILKLFNIFELNLIGESNLCKKYYYYFGLADKMQLNKEILNIKKELQHINVSSLNNYDCLFYKCIENFIEYFENQLYKRHDYRALLKRIQLIKNNYPSVQSFLDDKKISDFSINEQKSILEIIDIQNEISYIEIEEAFKLGQKENNII